MKEDVLEQIVDQYLNLQGYFTVANVRYKPQVGDIGYQARQDSVTSDIDVIGYNPHKSGAQKVVAVSCKSWQTGFWAGDTLQSISKNKIVSGREAWRAYRELTSDKWAHAFKRTVSQLTGQQEFEHWTACVLLKDPENRKLWTENADFQKRLTPYLEIISLPEMFQQIHSSLTTTPAGSDLGRLIQVLKAANIKFC